MLVVIFTAIGIGVLIVFLLISWLLNRSRMAKPIDGAWIFIWFWLVAALAWFWSRRSSVSTS